MIPIPIAKLKEILGRENVLDSVEDRITYSYDGTPLLQRLPDAILIPQRVDHISRVLKLANEEGFAVVPRGSGSGLSGGSIPVENSVVLLMSKWNRILEIDERNLTAWVEPGVITAQLHQAVENRGLFYPPDPGSSSICTIGGNVAENAGGLRGLKYGVTKNYVLGLEVVLPNGDLLQTGGKSMKDVAGYNLRDVLVGSEGTLGIFTKILVKLIPKPETSRTMLAFFPSLGDLGESVSDIIASKITPAALEFLDNTTIRCVEEYAKLGLPTNVDALLLVEVDGRDSVVEDDAERIIAICKRHSAESLIVAKDEKEAIRLRTARKAAFSSLARVRPTTILEDATVPPSEVPEMLERIRQIAANLNLTFGIFGHAGDGNLHPTCLTDERNADEISRATKGFEEIFGTALKLGGTITGEHGVGLAKKNFFERNTSSAGLEMMRSLKNVLDPNSVLNPGKIFSLRPRCEGALPRTKEQVDKFLAQGAFL
ncbi:MAG TPA: FAD-linked oxidase C-terminal domain-containing protein [Bacteroidota bacterium]|nr:FAD-linked oxidase C-terminal domain-containing protein [Bacteroidota bacterium]